MSENGGGTLPPAGWYQDPSFAGGLRWWDGWQWTAYTALAPRTLAPAAPAAAAPRQPRRWLGRFGSLWIGAAFAVVWLYLLLVVILAFGDGSPAQTVFILGGFGIAAAFLYTMCYRLRPSDRLAPSTLLLIFLIGGFAATIIPIMAEPVVRELANLWGANSDLVLSLVAGPIEEFSKIFVVILIAYRLPVRSTRTGLFVGGAVGFGFSGFENLEYGLAAISGHHNPNILRLVGVVLAREASGPFAHPLWTSLLAAAVFTAWRGRRVRITWRVVGAYGLVASAHSLWDAATPAWFAIFGDRAVASGVGFAAVLLLSGGGALVWWRVFRRANRQAPIVATAPAGTPPLDSAAASAPTDRPVDGEAGQPAHGSLTDRTATIQPVGGSLLNAAVAGRAAGTSSAGFGFAGRPDSSAASVDAPLAAPDASPIAAPAAAPTGRHAWRAP